VSYQILMRFVLVVIDTGIINKWNNFIKYNNNT
jgi:hypothetical protein